MSKINYHVLNDSIVLNYDSKTVVMGSTDKRYGKVLAAIRENRLSDIPSIAEAVEKAFEGTGFELKDGQIVANGEVLPAELSDRILKFKDQELPYAALFAFWNHLKNNPSFNARRMLFKFLEHNGHPLTDDGYFIAYRGVTEDFKDLHTKTFDNKPGSVCEIDRSLVDDNPNNTCSSGLHVACYDYAKGFGPRLIEVKVNPADVVCVPTDYNGTKMRVSRFEVISECENLRNEELYGKARSEVESGFVDCFDPTEGDDETDEDACPECGEYRDAFDNFCSGCGYEF